MVRVNLVLMILLCIGVVGAAVMLALGGGGEHETDRLRLERLLYDASDADGDLARAAREEILKEGGTFLPVLRTLADSDDSRLSREARSFLEELEKGNSPGGGETAVRLELFMDAGVVGDGVVPMLEVTIANGSRETVHVTTGREKDFRPYGWFEIRKGAGKWVACEPGAPVPGGDIGEIKAVEAGSRFSLSFSGERVMVMLEEADACELRFVFAAESGFDYRNVMLRHAGGRNPMPDVRLISNVLRFRFVTPSS